MADGNGERGQPNIDDPASRAHLEKYVLRLLDENRDEVRNADTKTNIVFATVTFVVGYVAALLFDDTSAFRSGSDAATAAATLSLGLFLLALLLLALAVTPRLGVTAPGRARYFQEQADFADAESMLAVLEEEAEQSVLRHSQQVFIMSRIARRKYHYLRISMLTVAGATVVLGIAGLVSIFD